MFFTIKTLIIIWALFTTCCSGCILILTTGHILHIFAPGLSLYVVVGQSTHTDDPVAPISLPYLPTGHFSHCDTSVVLL